MSIRLRILAGCLALTGLTGILGAYAQQAERELGALALRIYDEAFMGVSYLRSAQVGFASLVSAAQNGKLQPDAVSAVRVRFGSRSRIWLTHQVKYSRQTCEKRFKSIARMAGVL